MILCYLRPDSGHIGDKILNFCFEQKIWYFAVQTHFAPNFVNKDPLFWVDGSLDKQRLTLLEK